jgi:4-amino-4-deoxy-L-arabinose transferase-like glycosyltransferase
MLKYLERPSTRNFIIIVSVLSLLMYTYFYFQRPLAPDETSNLLMGKKMLQFDYPEDFFHRMPLIPLLASLFFAIGLGAASALFVIPLIFILLSIPTTYYFTRDITSEKTARLSVILLMLFFVFWRWGVYVITDTPLLVFMTLTLLFFLRGMNDAKNTKNFYYFGIVLGLSSVTKLSFVILPLFILAYIVYRKKTRLLQKKELWFGAFIALAIFLSSFTLVQAMQSDSDQTQNMDMIEARMSGDTFVIGQVLTGYDKTSALQFVQLALFPLLVFAASVLSGKFRKKNMFLLAYVGIFILFFVTVWFVRLRYFSPIFPVVMILIAEGYFFLREHFKKWQKIVDAAFIILAVASLMNTFYLMSLDSGSMWSAGSADELATYTSGLDGLILSDYLPDYLNLTGDVFMKPVFNESSVSDEIFRGNGNFSKELLRENNIKYIVLSLYDEWNRMPNTSASFHPYFGPIEITFISRAYSNGRIPPDYSFRSDLYSALEADPAYTRVHEISRGEQVVFIIYKVAY